MTIPKSFEALAADLASEKIISKTLLGQKEAYMMLADKGRLDLSESKAREAALREDLESIKASVDGYDSPEHAAQVADEMGYQCDALQQRLTVAEKRAGELEGLLKGSLESVKFDLEKVESPEAEKYLVALIDGIEAALNPAAEGEGS